MPFESRALVGCGLAAISIVVFQEVEPYHDPATNTLAVAAQWQLSLTYFFAFTLSTNYFATERSLYRVGVALLLVNLVIIVAALVMGIAKNRQRMLKEATIAKLRGHLFDELANVYYRYLIEATARKIMKTNMVFRDTQFSQRL